jgi:hypothetical protein
MVKLKAIYKPLIKPTKCFINYKSLIISNNKDYLLLNNLFKTIKLANAHLEYFNPLNIKSMQLLAKEYKYKRTIL